MKLSFLIATIFLQLLLVVISQLLDNFEIILGIFIACLVIGAFIHFSKSVKNSFLKNLGFGLFYGSLISSVSVAGFMIWLSYNFPK